MAYISQVHTQPLLERVGGFFKLLFSSIDFSASANARLNRIETLNAKTDEELMEIGLRREDITRYVFRDLYHI